jgi:hypothetical protein
MGMGTDENAAAGQAKAKGRKAGAVSKRPRDLTNSQERAEAKQRRTS